MYQFGTVITSILQARYPGGLQGFRDDGGLIDILKGDPVQVLIYHPNLKEFPEEIKNTLQGISERAQIPLKFTDFKLDIAEEDYMEMPHKLIEIFVRHNLFGVTLRLTSLCVIMTPMVPITAKDLDAAIAEIQQNLPEITRLAIVRESGLTLYEMPPKTPPEQTVYLEDLPTRDKPITEDDITDLKIALGKITSVDDFINSL